MSSTPRPRHVVVDGSNIATEGRSMPSLAQLNEAVLAFMAERPEVTVTVVVDATFGHRIHKSEVAEFDAAVANNELVAPPAGAVGRGDAFVLGIADKAGAMVLSNDSFQEFHGTYDWLFDEGRLVGGKPVPHVGWVFVDRVPVRGPVSRRAVREPSKRPGSGGSRTATGTARIGSKEASLPMPVPTSPPPGRSGSGRSGGRGRQAADAPVLLDTRTAPAAAAKVAAVAGTGSSDRPSGRAGEPVNDVMPFLDFVEHHPVGSSVNATVESYSSHGAYVTIGEVRGYVPLRLMDDPMPRAAKHVMKIGDAVTLVVVSFNPGRRSIDCAVPHMVGGLHLDEVLPPAVADGDDAAAAPAPKRSRSGRKQAAAAPAPAASTEQPTEEPSEAVPAPSTPSPRKRAASKKAAASTTPATETERSGAPATGASTPAKKAAAKRTRTNAAATVATGPEAPTPDAPATETPATETPAAAARPRKAPTSRTSKRTRAAAAAPATDAAATVAPAADAPATTDAPTKAAARKASPKKAAAKQAAPTKAAAKQAAPRKAAATKQAATKASAATKAAAGRSTTKAAAKAPATKRASKQAAAERGS